jgi:type II secretory pathway pseudopilin PulG
MASMKPARTKGFALLPLIIGILILGVLIGAGLTLIGPMVKKAKYDDAKDVLDATTQSVIAWSIANGRLPDAAGFAAIVPGNRDAWGRQIIYIYDNNLTAVATGGLCGRQSTALSYGASVNVAFLLVSGAEDLTINTTPGVSGAYIGNVVSGTADLVRAVSLESLRNQAGCFSFSSGRLKILNNELPKVCAGTSYALSLQGEGGVPNYVWTVNTKPLWLTTSPNGNALNLIGTPLSGDVGDNVLDLAVTDADGNTIQRRFTIKVLSCGP